MNEARRPVDVAVGILRDAQHRVLLGQRPAGKSYAGYWEFPGGKLEAGESAVAALQRELREELGIAVGTSTPLLTLIHHYPEYSVRLFIREISAFQGEARPREAQELSWVAPDALHQWRLLPADGPIVQAIRLPKHYVFTAQHTHASEIEAGLGSLPPGAMLRLRLPGLDDAKYRAAAARLVPAAAARGLGVMLDRDPAWVGEFNAAGLHLSQARLAQAADLRAQLPTGCWLAGSVHDEQSLAQAATLDFAVLGPVLATASHPGSPALGWRGFSDLVMPAALPVYGIGGLAADDLAAAQAAGGQGVAGISAYWSGVPGGVKSSS